MGQWLMVVVLLVVCIWCIRYVKVSDAETVRPFNDFLLLGVIYVALVCTELLFLGILKWLGV